MEGAGIVQMWPRGQRPDWGRCLGGAGVFQTCLEAERTRTQMCYGAGGRGARPAAAVGGARRPARPRPTRDVLGVLIPTVATGDSPSAPPLPEPPPSSPQLLSRSRSPIGQRRRPSTPSSSPIGRSRAPPRPPPPLLCPRAPAGPAPRSLPAGSARRRGREGAPRGERGGGHRLLGGLQLDLPPGWGVCRAVGIYPQLGHLCKGVRGELPPGWGSSAKGVCRGLSP